jgi:hypothetical protein
MIEEQSQFKALKARHPPLLNYGLQITNYGLRMETCRAMSSAGEPSAGKPSAVKNEE